MILRQSYLGSADSSNIMWVRVFHTYRGFSRKVAHTSDCIKASARIISPPQLIYAGFKTKTQAKGDIVRFVICRTVFFLKKKNSVKTSFNSNQGIQVKKKNTPTYKHFNGPVPKTFRFRKIATLFKSTV
jgi:ribosomal protein L14